MLGVVLLAGATPMPLLTLHKLLHVFIQSEMPREGCIECMVEPQYVLAECSGPAKDLPRSDSLIRGAG